MTAMNSISFPGLLLILPSPGRKDQFQISIPIPLLSFALSLEHWNRFMNSIEHNRRISTLLTEFEFLADTQTEGCSVLEPKLLMALNFFIVSDS